MAFQRKIRKPPMGKPTTSIAKDLGVSDKAVEKHVKKLGLTKPPRGYWVKQKEKD